MVTIPIGIGYAVYTANKTVVYSPGDDIPRWRQVVHWRSFLSLVSHYKQIIHAKILKLVFRLDEILAQRILNLVLH